MLKFSCITPTLGHQPLGRPAVNEVGPAPRDGLVHLVAPAAGVDVLGLDRTDRHACHLVDLLTLQPECEQDVEIGICVEVIGQRRASDRTAGFSSPASSSMATRLAFAIFAKLSYTGRRTDNSMPLSRMTLRHCSGE